MAGIARDRILALLWSGKESALKALRAGLRLDTRSVIVLPCIASVNRTGWNQLRVRYSGGRCSEGRVFHGYWQNAKSVVRTVVAAPPPDPPISLRSRPKASTVLLGWTLFRVESGTASLLDFYATPREPTSSSSVQASAAVFPHFG